MKYEVKNQEIHKELRTAGKVLRTLVPCITESKIKRFNWFYNKFKKGRWKSDKTDCVSR